MTTTFGMIIGIFTVIAGLGVLFLQMIELTHMREDNENEIEFNDLLEEYDALYDDYEFLYNERHNNI